MERAFSEIFGVLDEKVPPPRRPAALAQYDRTTVSAAAHDPHPTPVVRTRGCPDAAAVVRTQFVRASAGRLRPRRNPSSLS